MARTATFDVEGVPPLDGTSVTVPPGVTVLCDEPFEKRSALMECLRVGLGSGECAVEPDGDGGHVAMTLDGSTYERHLERSAGQVVVSGDRYLAAAGLADRYAFLLESTVGGRSIADAEVLREVLFDPSDVAEKTARAGRLMDDVSRLNQQLASDASSEEKLSALADRREALDGRIERLEERLDRAEPERGGRPEAGPDGGPSRSGTHPGPTDARDARDDLRDVRYEVRTTLEAMASLRDEHRSLRSELQDLDGRLDGSTGDHPDRVATLRREKERLQRSISQLGNVIELASGLLERDGSVDLLEELADSHEGDPPGAPDDEVVCWMCGSAVESGQVGETVRALESIRADRIAEMDEIESAIDATEREKDRQRSARDRKRELERSVTDVEAEIEDRREVLDALRRRRSSLVSDIEGVQDDLRSREREEVDGQVAREREANRLALDLHRADAEWEDLMERRNRVVRRLETGDELRAERADKNERRAELLAEIDATEGDIVDRFNDALGVVVEAVDPDAFEVAWVELRESRAGEGRRDRSRDVPDLYLSMDGDAPRASGVTVGQVDGRRGDVAALVTRLAGYHVHAVHETVPFALLEPPTGLDEAAVERTLQFLAERAEYVVVSPRESFEDAASDGYDRIRSL